MEEGLGKDEDANGGWNGGWNGWNEKGEEGRISV